MAAGEGGTGGARAVDPAQYDVEAGSEARVVTDQPQHERPIRGQIEFQPGKSAREGACQIAWGGTARIDEPEVRIDHHRRIQAEAGVDGRSEERRVGKEGRSRW